MKKTLFATFNVNLVQIIIFESMKFFLLGLILLISTQLSCQNQLIDSLKKVFSSSENFRETLELSQEPSTISGTKFTDYHSGIKKPYLFHGDFQFGITLGGESYISGKRRAWFHALQFIPAAKIRILQNDPQYNDKSKPVRTPSFNPRLYYFVTNEHFWNEKRKIFLATGIGHHSNGQDGTEFVDYTDTVNIYNGSFSESLINYVLIGGQANFNIISKTIFKKISNTTPNFKELNKNNKTKKGFKISLDLNWKIGFEYHPSYFSNQKFHNTGVYGGNRVFVNFQLLTDNTFFKEKRLGNKWFRISEKIKETNRLSFNFEYITDLSYYSGGYNHLEKIKLFDASKRLNVSLTYYKRFLDSKYPAFFAQVAYYGSDNYNIYFQKSSFQARIGLAFGFFKYEKVS